MERLCGRVSVYSPPRSYCIPQAYNPLLLRKESLKIVLPNLFDRERELAFCRRFVKQPGHLLLLIGPPNCGKTAILKQLVMKEEGVTWIDLRAGNFTTAENFIEGVGAALQESIALDGLSIKFEWGPLAGSKTTAKQTLQFQEDLGAYLTRHKAGVGRVPTLIIDEANVLSNWVHDNENQNALASLLRFFVKITKQDGLANVLLATSEYFMKFWLEEQIGSSVFGTQAIGDFPEAEARSFFNEKLNTTCSEGMWKQVYNLCGGRVFHLKMIAENVCCEGEDSLMMYLEELYDRADADLQRGLRPAELNLRHVPACWTPDNFMEIMKELCKHPNGVMPWKDFLALPSCSEGIAKALICYNLVHFRPRSRLAHDLSWYKGRWPVVTPMSQAHFVAMHDMVK